MQLTKNNAIIDLWKTTTQGVSNMGILDNLESYLEAEVQETDKCHYCQAIAIYNDLAEVEKNYQIVGVCACHAFKGLSS